MMDHQITQTLSAQSKTCAPGLSRHSPWVGLSLGIGAFVLAAPAFAHHPLGGQQPTTFIEGILSGLGHPILGPDHFAFIVALGLVVTVLRHSLKQLIWIPAGFVLASLLGVGLHLMAIDIPASEAIVASTVIGGGGLLIFGDRIQSLTLLGFGAIAGLFHGYVYGESIIGAEPAPLLAYLIGLSLIQMGIAGAAFGVGRVFQSFLPQNSVTLFRYTGLIFSAIGIVLLGNTLVG